MEVVNVDPGKTLVLSGALGPLQSMAATGSMTIQLSAAGDRHESQRRVRCDWLPAWWHEFPGSDR